MRCVQRPAEARLVQRTLKQQLIDLLQFAQCERGRQCMERQVPLIKGGWNAVRELLDTLDIREGFREFVSWCQENAITFAVVSDGLDRVIEYILKRHGIAVNRIYSNHLIESVKGEFSLSFSSRPRLSGCQSGVCKCQIAGQPAYQVVRTVIGDGRSDFCWAKEADLLFARAKLVDYCRSQGLQFNDFSSFIDIKLSLVPLLKGQTAHLNFNKTPLLVPQTQPTLLQMSEISAQSLVG